MEAIIFCVLVHCIIMGCFCSFLATNKNYDAGNWFCLGFFFSIIALITLCGMKVWTEEDERQEAMRKARKENERRAHWLNVNDYESQTPEQKENSIS
jgi:hypothetical protein